MGGEGDLVGVLNFLSIFLVSFSIFDSSLKSKTSNLLIGEEDEQDERWVIEPVSEIVSFVVKWCFCRFEFWPLFLGLNNATLCPPPFFFFFFSGIDFVWIHEMQQSRNGMKHNEIEWNETEYSSIL